jgi:hypothetical protein
MVISRPSNYLKKCQFNKMKVTLNWLKKYVDFNWWPEAPTGRLAVSGVTTGLPVGQRESMVLP